MSRLWVLQQNRWNLSQPVTITILISLTMSALALKADAQESFQASASLTAAAPTPKKYSLSLSTKLGASRVEDIYVKSTVAGAELGLDAKQFLLPTITSQISLGVNLYTGNASSYFTDEGRPNSGVSIREASVTYKASSNVSALGGVIRTRFSPGNSVLSRSFPGVSERLKFGDDFTSIRLEASQVMPTSGTVSLRVLDDDTSPYLLVHTLAASVGKDLSARLNLTHFKFKDLGSGSAQDSRFYGNTVDGYGKQNARFVYTFEGFETGAGIDYRISDSFAVSCDGYYTLNNDAPISKRAAFATALELKYSDLTYEIAPSLNYFRAESDVLPASYSSSGFGSNNRQGFGVGLKLNFPKDLVGFSGSWAQANKIEDNPYMGDRSVIRLQMEAKYDLL